MSSNPYRIVGVIGLLVALAAGAPQLADLPAGSARSLGVIGWLLLGCFLTVVLSRERRLLLGNLSLFVPLGWLLFFLTLLALSAGLGLLAFVAIFFAVTLNAVWTSLLVLRAVAGERVRDVLAETFRESFSRYWRGLGVRLIGNGVVVLLTLIMIKLMGVTFGLALALMAAAALAWNLLTEPLLLTVLATDCPFTEACGRSWRYALKRTREWLWPLVAQLFLTGFIVYLHVSWRSISNRHTTTLTNVSMNWVGGYPHESAWLSEYVETLEI